MRRVPLLLAPAILVLAACGGGAADTAATSAASDATSAAPSTSEAAPSPTAAPSTTAPAPAGELFVDVVDQALEPYAALIGTSLSSADPASALPLFDGDVPLPAGNVVGAGRLVEQWGDTLEVVQMIGLDTAPDKDDLEDYGAAAPSGWAYNSISTTDSSRTLVMTRASDGLRVVFMSSIDPGPGVPPAEFRLEAETSELPQPAWLASLPVPPGGEITAVGEGIGQVGASYFDVSAGDWVGQIVVGEMIDGDQSFATVQWFLTRP